MAPSKESASDRDNPSLEGAAGETAADGLAARVRRIVDELRPLLEAIPDDSSE